MTSRTKLWKATGLGCLALTALALAGPLRVDAQQGNADAQAKGNAGAEPGAVVLFLPSGDRTTGSLMLEAMVPAEVPVGKSFDYRIRATNISRNLVLEDVRIHQSQTEGFSIEKSEPKPEEGQGEGQTTWSVEKLKPGESKTWTVTGLSDKEGMEAGCLSAEYKPSLCLVTKFIKPSLQVTKTAPERVDICEPLMLRYTVRNTGSGPARNVRVTDDLPQGLTLADGGRKVEFNAGELGPDQSRDFQIRVNPAKTGSFASRAYAEAEGDLSAKSNRTETTVAAAELAVNITGPQAQYVNQPMTYQVEVTNTGDAPAVDTQLTVQVDESARVMSVSRSEPGRVEPRQSGRTLVWNLGNIEPEQSRVISFTGVARDKADLRHTAQAVALCARDDQDRMASVTSETQILTFPALLLEMVDEQDPVRVGDTEVYTVSVLNQGSGEDRDVKVEVELPQEYSFVDAVGDTDTKADGRTVTLGPVDRLAPRERVTWRIRARVEKPGDVRTQVKLSSEYLSDKPVTETEPTRLIGTSDSGDAEPTTVKSGDRNQGQQKGQQKGQSKDQKKNQSQDQ